MNLHRSLRSGLFLLGGALLAISQVQAEENFTRFRGETGSGVSPQKGIPTQWSPGDFSFNVLIPGVGHSSPVVWKDKLFVTSATDQGAIRYLHCLNAATGDKIWSKLTGGNPSRKHAKSSYASSTPAVDGERVYVMFADKENFVVTAYDFTGELIWRRNLGPYVSQHGLGVSPIIYNGKLIVVNDQDGPSSISALDCKTGQTVWTTLRDFEQQSTSYSTPIIYQPAGKKAQLITSSKPVGVAGYDPDTGHELWRSGRLPARTVGSPIVADGLIIQACGGGGRGTILIGVDPTGSGDVSKTHVKFSRNKVIPYVPTPIYYGNHLYLWNDDGTAACVDIKSGKTVWQRRVGGNYSGSPLCVDGKIYVMSEKGEVMIIAASPEFKSYGKVEIGDPSHSTPSIANGRLYFRTFHRLACLEAKQ